MGFSEGERWWERWQLRVLVLGSLSLQLFLTVAAALRKRRTPPWSKLLTWAAYLGSDALAIYALAALFNRHRRKPGGVLPSPRGSAALEALWAPVLLIHLGGQDGFTAYSIQDNELWRRHLFAAASQVGIAVYVFRKSWPGGDKRLLLAAILLFVPGILKCLMHCEPEDKEVRLHRPIPDQLFVDLPYPYSVRLDNLKHVLCGGGAHRLLRSGLSLTFDRLYTSNKGYGHPAGALLRAVLVALTLVPIPVIATAVSRGGTAAAYDDGADLSVTYVLLCCTAGLDVASALSMACLRRMRRPPWPDQVAQCNLVAYLVHSEQRGWLCRIACLLLGCRGYLDWLWCTAPSRSAPSPSGITELVHSHICTQWMEHVKGDADAYRAFSDSRGHWTLDKEWPLGGEKRSFDNVASSSLRRRPFDESVVVWHLATDFCFYSRVDDGSTANRRCREISNYMVYLLLVNPAMLMPGARRGIVTAP